MKITILVDDCVGRPGLKPEHGLAMWIEADGRNILFDTGQGSVLEDNARMLGINLDATETVVLSHGHYDHTGGLGRVLRRAPGAHVYGHPGVVLPRYSIRGGTARPLSMPQPSLAALQRLPENRLHWFQQPIMLTQQIGLSGPIPRRTGYEDTGGPFFLDRKGKRPDPLDDDLAVWLRAKNGLVVCVGCAHSGLINTLEHVRRMAGERRVRAVIGGFHLTGASPERLEKTIAALRAIDPQRLHPCHCTGDTAIARMRDALGEKVAPAAAGTVLSF